MEVIVLDAEIQVLQRLNAASNIWLKKQSESQLEIESPLANFMKGFRNNTAHWET